MGLDITNLGTFVAGGMSVYMFFWNQGRAKKADDEDLQKTISTGNERQDKDTERLGEHLHKRIGELVTLLSEIQYKLGFGDGFKEGMEKGLAEARTQFDLMMKVKGL